MIYKNNFISFKYTDANMLFITVENSIIPSDNEFNEFIKWMEDIFVNKIKTSFCMIIDINKLIMLSYTRINKFTELLNNIKLIIRSKLIATSVICSSTVSKTLLNWFFKLYKPERPCKVFNVEEDYSPFILENFNKYISSS